MCRTCSARTRSARYGSAGSTPAAVRNLARQVTPPGRNPSLPTLPRPLLRQAGVHVCAYRPAGAGSLRCRVTAGYGGDEGVGAAVGSAGGAGDVGFAVDVVPADGWRPPVRDQARCEDRVGLAGVPGGERARAGWWTRASTGCAARERQPDPRREPRAPRRAAAAARPHITGRPAIQVPASARRSPRGYAYAASRTRG
jgi:hypothetical protein